MKRKLYISIILVLLPSIMYLCVFYLNDPHGYFGNKGSSSNELIDHMLDWKNGSYNAVIIGDSRMTSFEQNFISELNNHTGYNYKNMSYGGAMGTEMNYLTQWCIEQKAEIKSVIIVTGWYNFNELLQQNRVKSTNKIIENPLSYAFSIDNMKDLISQFKGSMDDNGVEKEPTLEEKEEFLQIAMENMSKYLSGYKTDDSVIEELISICQYCKENNISIKIVVPPWMDRFYKELSEYGDYDLDEYKIKLSAYTDIYDMEYETCLLNKRFEDFSDYSHFHDKTYVDFADEIIYEKLEYARLWKQGIAVNN